MQEAWKMAFETTIRQHPLQGLLSDLPKLLLQYKMAEQETSISQARIDAEKEIQIANLLFSFIQFSIQMFISFLHKIIC